MVNSNSTSATREGNSATAGIRGGGGASNISDYYQRQQSLPILIPDELTVIGIGGVGFWVALASAMAGVKKLILIDGDDIQPLNLNRIPVKPSDIGKNKAELCGDFISKIRPECVVVPVAYHYEKPFLTMVEGMVIECTDNMEVQSLLEKQFKEKIWHLHYNGFDRLTVENYISDKEWGEPQNHYDVVPSFVAPAMAVASIGLFFAFSEHRKSVELWEEWKKVGKSFILGG